MVSVDGTPGVFAELLATAHERGNLTAGEIAEIVTTPEVTIEYNAEWSIGD